MNLKEAFRVWENEFEKKWNEYVDLHKKLDEYRGVDINESNVQQINEIVSALQDQYAVLYPSINYIVHRNPLCITAMKEYNQFIDDIKNGGARPEDWNAEAKA